MNHTMNATHDPALRSWVASANQADLSCVMCHRSINYVADMLETKYGIPWIKVNFIGAEATAVCDLDDRDAGVVAFLFGGGAAVVPTPKATQPSAPLCGVCESVPTMSCPGSAYDSSILEWQMASEPSRTPSRSPK